ncbi:MAG: nitroreductase [Polyangiales bacterium]
MTRGIHDFDRAVRERRSVRGFLPKAVPDDVLQEVFGLAQYAPSNCNVQPWRVYVASGQRCASLREALVAAVRNGEPPHTEHPIDEFFDGYRRKQIDCAVELYGKMGVARDDVVGRFNASLRNFEFFDAPHVAYVCMSKRFGIGVALDVGMYVQTLMLAMWSRGIGSCAQASLRSYPHMVAQHLDIPADEQILCGLSFGYEDEQVSANATRQPRDAFDANVFHKR